MDLSVSIIGAGRMGGALALALSRAGIRVENLVSRDRTRAEKIQAAMGFDTRILDPSEFAKLSSKVILIATSDAQIKSIVDELSLNLRRACIIAHTSGAFSSEELNSLRAIKCSVGSFHPLVSVSEPIGGSQNFPGTFFCIEGDDEATKALRTIAEKLGGKTFSVEKNMRSLYHASAVSTAGHVVALFSVACELLSRCGIEKKQTKEILLPLLKSTIRNIEALSIEDALTGTFARGDSETFLKHLEALGEYSSRETTELYLRLGAISAELVSKHLGTTDSLKDFQALVEQEILARHGKS